MLVNKHVMFNIESEEKIRPLAPHQADEEDKALHNSLTTQNNFPDADLAPDVDDLDAELNSTDDDPVEDAFKHLDQGLDDEDDDEEIVWDPRLACFFLRRP